MNEQPRACTDPECALTGVPQPAEAFAPRKRGGTNTRYGRCRACIRRRYRERAETIRASEYEVDRETGGLLDIRPFRGWLREQKALAAVVRDGPQAWLAIRLEVPERTLERWLSESDTVQLDTVDRAFCAWGDSTLLRTLYPHLYDFGRAPATELHSQALDITRAAA